MVLTCEEVVEEMKTFPPRVWQARRLLEERLEEAVQVREWWVRVNVGDVWRQVAKCVCE